MAAPKVNSNPQIDAIEPQCALPGGEVRILGHGLGPAEMRRPAVHFGEVDGSVVISSDQFIVARVPQARLSSLPMDTVATRVTSASPSQSLTAFI